MEVIFYILCVPLANFKGFVQVAMDILFMKPYFGLNAKILRCLKDST